MTVWIMMNRKDGRLADIAPQTSATQARFVFLMRWNITQAQASAAGWRAVKFQEVKP